MFGAIPPGRRGFAAAVLSVAMLGPLAVAPGHQEPLSAAVEPPTMANPKAPRGYQTRPIEGWQVVINGAFLKGQPELADCTLKLIGYQLYQITRVVPPEALAKLRKIRIWVEENEPHHPCMTYHPDPNWLREHDMSPEKAGCVELANARTFLEWTIQQPWMLLHELSHGYHQQFLDAGFDNPEVKAVYEHAMQAGLYDRVLRSSGEEEKAYAATNPMEYFAEISEAYFGTNDFYPFVRAELKRHDPMAFEMLETTWGVHPAAASKTTAGRKRSRGRAAVKSNGAGKDPR
jgi:hypothetical protein